MRKLVFIFFVVQVVRSQNCRSDWTNLRTCMKDHYNDYSAQRRLSDNDRSNLEGKIRDCYSQQECQDPFPSSSVSNAAKDCYYDTQPRLRQDVQTCVQKEFKDFDMPEDDALAYLWMQDEVYVKAAEEDSKVCGPYINQNNLNLCVTKAIEDAFTNPNQKQDMCDVRRQCAQQTKQDCLARWREKAKPKVCACMSDQKKMTSYKNQYKSCIAAKKANVSDFDVYAKFIDNAKTKFCGPQTDPCGGDGKNKTSTTTQNPIGALVGQLSGGNGNSGAPNLLSNLARLVTGSGGSLIRGSTSGGGSTSNLSGGNLGGLTNVGVGLTSLFNSLTGGSNPLGGSNPFGSLSGNNQGINNIANALTGGNPMATLKQILSDTPGFGSLKGDGGYGSLLAGSGTGYDVMAKRK